MGTYLKSFERFLMDRTRRINENEESGEGMGQKPDIFTDAEWAEFQVDHTIITRPGGTVDLTNAEFQGDFSRAELMGCIFENVKMENVDFSGADLTNATGLDKTQEVNGVPTFYTCNWKGADFTGVELTWLNPKHISNPDEFFAGCKGINKEDLDLIFRVKTASRNIFGGRFS